MTSCTPPSPRAFSDRRNWVQKAPSSQMRPTSLLLIPAVGTKGADQVIDLAGADAVQIRLHDHREQGLIDPAAALQQAGEDQPRPQFGDAQLDPRRWSSAAWAGARCAGPADRPSARLERRRSPR
jgi:hypothetical protein